MKKEKPGAALARGKKAAYTEEDMARGVPILSDIVFKYIFGTTESAEILKTFINAVLTDAGFPEIAAVSVVNPFNVEVQVRTQADYQERSLYYWAKSYSDQLTDGELYGILKKVISISILNFRLFPDHIPYHSCFMLRENSSPEYALTDDCVMHYLEVPKLLGKPEKEIEKWLYFIQYGDKEDETVKVLIDNDKMLQAAKQRYEYFIADERARIAYQQRSMFLHDQANYIHTARLKGLAEGREEGREEGARRKALETARRLLDRGMEKEEIAEITGLPPEELP